MPKVDRGAFDPRETCGLANAIPKRTLRAIAADYGTNRAMAAALSSHGRKIAPETLSMWLNGRRRMSDESVLYVADALAISPTYVLDLASYDPRAARGMGVVEYLRAIGEATTPQPTRWAGYRGMLLELADALATDYADADEAEPIAADARGLARALAPAAGWWPNSPECCGELRAMLADMPGDYRDPLALAAAALEFYAGRAANADEALLNAVFRAGLSMKFQ